MTSGSQHLETVIVVISEATGQSDLDRVIDLVASTAARTQLHRPTLLSASGDGGAVAAALAGERCVLGVTSLPAPYPLASADSRLGIPSRVALDPTDIGPDGFTVIAGPCSVASEEQILDVAAAVAESGAHALRGSVYEPKASAYGSATLGHAQLDILAHAKAVTGLPVVTEILDIRDVAAVAERVDMLQVGARSMHNHPLLRELGRLRQPVLLQRGLSATVEQTLLAAECILSGGNEQLVLCEQGLRSFASPGRIVLDLGTIATLKERTHVPVIVDSGRAASRRQRVIPFALAAAAMGADGILVDSHHNADRTHCGQQALPATELPDLIYRLHWATAASGRVMRTRNAGGRPTRTAPQVA